MKYIISLLGYVFIALVSILSAMAVNSVWLRILLYTSSVISLGLAVKNVINDKKMKKEIEDLKNNQLSVSFKGDTLVFKEGAE